MPSFAPFTVFIKVVPDRGPAVKLGDATKKGGRIDYTRALQKLSIKAYDQLTQVADLHFTTPGGGQQESSGMTQSIAYGTAVKPQFANTPAQLTIEGFYTGGTGSEQPIAPRTMVLMSNQVLEGDLGEKPQLGPAGDAYPAIQDEIRDLLDEINTAISGIVDASGNSIEVFRLSYKNIVWGDRGHTFPV